MKVLFLHPDLKNLGGIENYYLKIIPKFRIEAHQFVIGKRFGERGRWSQLVRFIRDYILFWKFLSHSNIDVLVTNPSLDPKGIIRDGLFLFIAKIRDIKTVLFIHGWYQAVEEKIESRFLRWFKLFLGRTDVFIVLSQRNEDKLRSWGFHQPIYREVMVFDESIQNGFDIHRALQNRENSRRWRILFLARILRQKGIYELLDAFAILRKKHSMIEIVVAGDGVELSKVKEYVKEKKILDVSFTGYVRGSQKFSLMENTHIYCLPSYSEGMPNSVIEAMAFGLPVITRTVGGLVDFFRNGQHGFITPSKKPEDFATMIENLFEDRELFRKISLNNFRYARENFTTCQAARRLEKIYNSVLKS